MEEAELDFCGLGQAGGKEEKSEVATVDMPSLRVRRGCGVPRRFTIHPIAPAGHYDEVPMFFQS